MINKNLLIGLVCGFTLGAIVPVYSYFNPIAVETEGFNDICEVEMIEGVSEVTDAIENENSIYKFIRVL